MMWHRIKCIRGYILTTFERFSTFSSGTFNAFGAHNFLPSNIGQSGGHLSFASCVQWIFALSLKMFIFLVDYVPETIAINNYNVTRLSRYWKVENCKTCIFLYSFSFVVVLLQFLLFIKVFSTSIKFGSIFYFY